MRRFRTAVPAAAMAIALASSGCSVPPPIVTGNGTGPTIADIVTHIQCEIHDFQTAKGVPADDKDLVAKFNQGHYVAYVNLTLDATTTQGVTPGFNFINKAATLVGIVNFQMSGQQHRNLNPTFTLDLSPDSDTSRRIDTACKTAKEDPLGIKGISDWKM